MSYNWEKIFKNKTDKELYHIYLGEKHLGSEAIKFAELELKTRNFNFKNIEKQKKKWELDKLIEDERSEKGFIGNSFGKQNSIHFLIMSIFGGVLTLMMILDYFFNFMNQTDTNNDPFNQILLLVIFFISSVVGLFLFRSKRKQEIERKKKIKELIDDI